MRKSELISSVKKLNSALTESRMLESVEQFLTNRNVNQSPQFSSSLLVSLNSYSLLANTFDETTKTLVEILKLDVLTKVSAWLIYISEDGRSDLVELRANIRFALKFLPKIVNLLESEITRQVNKPEEEKAAKFQGKEILSVLLIEDDDRFSSPQRLVEILESINLLYEACSIITDTPYERLGVVACDSGSDKSFDFLGNAKALECLKDTIFGLWDRIVFFREKKVLEHIDVIAKSLPIYEKIGELEQNQKISPEQAELLRRDMSVGVRKFAESGATIPELGQRSYYNPRELMAPEPKLLTTSIAELPATHVEGEIVNESEDKPQATANASNFSGLSESEQQQLKRLLSKMNQGPPQQENDDTLPLIVDDDGV